MKSPARFYFDEHIPSAVAEGLRRRGIDVLTLVEADKLGADDEEHLAFARQQWRAIVTQLSSACQRHIRSLRRSLCSPRTINWRNGPQT